MTPEEIIALVEDPEPWQLLELLMIEDRHTKRYVPLNPTPEQRDWIETLNANKKSVVLKSRNVGLGVATQAFHFWRAWRKAWQGQAINTLVVAHASDTAHRHLDRYKDFNDRLPEEIRLVEHVKNATDYKLMVPGTDGNPEYAWFRAVTAGGKKGEGRGFTQQQAHFTEFAFYADANKNLGSVTSGMHDSEDYSVVVETTSNGMTGYYPDFYKEQDAPGATYAARFYPWYMNPTFREKVPDDAPPLTEEEKRYAIQNGGLDREQIQWRRSKLRSMTAEDFSRDFPATVDEAFAKSGDNYFAPAHLMRDYHEIVRRDRSKGKNNAPVGERVYLKPDPGETYVVAVDIGAGVGKDWSVIQVLTSKMEQAACYSDNESTPSEIADIAVRMAVRYNRATLLVEANSFGMSCVMRVQELGYPLYHERGKPFYVWGNESGGNKKEIFAFAKHQLDSGRPVIHDMWTVKELLGMSRQGPTRDRTKASRGHDDHAVAFVYGLWLCRGHKARADERGRRLTEITKGSRELVMGEDGLFRRSSARRPNNGLYRVYGDSVS